MDADVQIDAVEAVKTKNGDTRYVVRDADGQEYSTFRPAIGKAAAGFEGKRAHIQVHEEERNGFQNVYLDAISAAEESAPEAAPDPDEVAWNTAVEAAPWVLGAAA